MQEIKSKLNKSPKYFITSSKKKEGIIEVLTHINSTTVNYKRLLFFYTQIIFKRFSNFFIASLILLFSVAL